VWRGCYYFPEKNPRDLKTAVKSGKVKKFLVTYASFEKLVLCSKDKTKNFQLLVDESHMLTTANGKNYMHQQTRKILINYKKFKTNSVRNPG
jgi:hypothetical protein